MKVAASSSYRQRLSRFAVTQEPSQYSTPCADSCPSHCWLPSVVSSSYNSSYAFIGPVCSKAATLSTKGGRLAVYRQRLFALMRAQRAQVAGAATAVPGLKTV